MGAEKNKTKHTKHNKLGKTAQRKKNNVCSNHTIHKVLKMHVSFKLSSPLNYMHCVL